MQDFIPWIFAAITLVGVLYLLFNIVLGGLFDGDGGDMVAGDIDADGLIDSGEGHGVGCSAIAAFLAGFGAVGLLGSLSGWHLLISVIAALIVGVIFGRIVVLVLRFVMRQESTATITEGDLLGSTARVTVNTPAGKTGEAMLEGHQLLKYPIRDVTDSPLQKGDYVEVVEVREGRLYVKKKRM